MLKLSNGRVIAILAFCLTAFFVLGRSAIRPIQKNYAGPPLVLVLTTNSVSNGDRKTAMYLHKVVENRKAYAQLHGYQFVVKNLQSYLDRDGKALPDGWARLHAMREVLEEYPDSEWFWYLDQDAIIMDSRFSITKELLSPDRLNPLILRDVPIGPPGSLIRTLKNIPAESAQLILSHDHSGLNTKSFILRNGDFVRYLLDTWNEPMYRSYGFERQEVSALEHLVQWHYTVLSKAALLPKRLLVSYNNAAEDMNYKEGDFVVVLDGCRDPGRSCEMEFDRYWIAQSSQDEAN